MSPRKHAGEGSVAAGPSYAVGLGGIAISKRAGERAAVEQQVLARDIACMGRAQERAGGAELVRGAQALCRNGGDPLCYCPFDRNAALGRH